MRFIFYFLIFCSFNLFSKDLFALWSEWNAHNRQEMIGYFMPSKKNFNDSIPSSRSGSASSNVDSYQPLGFDSVIGGVPQEIKELKMFLEKDEAFAAVGADKPTGILMTGPPGTGKTMIAKALAYELDANFIAASASSFVEIYVGTGPKAIRDLFDKAKSALSQGAKHVIIFIDELDSIGSRQADMGIGGISESNKTINELLVQMDGFAKDNRITIIAATNRPEILDKALLRPGRFDYIINVDLPDKNKRIAIIEYYLNSRKRKLDPKIKENMNKLGVLCEGFNCAQLKDLVNRSSVIAVRKDRRMLMFEDMQEAIFQIKSQLV